MESLLGEYERGEPDAVKQVNELLAEQDESLDGLTAANSSTTASTRSTIALTILSERPPNTIAESRRNDTLREMIGAARFSAQRCGATCKR